MKNIYLTVLFIISIFTSNAQDIIVKNDKTEIKAKIEELTETTIKYKKIEMLDGPSYNINKRDVFMIIYKNGTKEYIESSTNTSSQTPIQNNPSIPNNTTIQVRSSANTQPAVGHTAMKKIRRGYYEFEGKKLKAHSDYMYNFDKYGYKDLSMRYKEGKNITLIGVGFGSAIFVTGLIIKNYGVELGGLVGVLAAGIVGTGIRENAIKEFNSRATLKLGYNSKLEIKPMMAGNSVGISIGL